MIGNINAIKPMMMNPKIVKIRVRGTAADVDRAVQQLGQVLTVARDSGGIERRGGFVDRYLEIVFGGVQLQLVDVETGEILDEHT